jgi:hypothetical protein
MTRLPSLELPGLPTLGGAAARRAPGVSSIAPEDEEGIIRKAGRKTLGGIAAVGNILDLPGSMVRDVLAMENPLDQLVHPFSGESRTSGRDLLRKYGMAGKKDTWGNFAGGLGVDILTDPLTYLFPFGAMTKGGTLVKQAGLLPKVRTIAAETANVGVKEIGPRQSMLKTTLADVMAKATPEEMTALQTAATKSGLNLNNLASEPLRGGFGIGFMGTPKKVMGFGKTAEKVATKLDDVGRTIRYGKIPGTNFSPTDSLATLFNSKLGHVTGEFGQIFAKQRFASREKDLAKAKQPIADMTRRLVTAGYGDEKYSPLIRQALEETTPGPATAQFNPQAQTVLGEMRDHVKNIRQSIVDEGGVIHEYTSPESAYFPRQGVTEEFVPPSSGTPGHFDVRNEFATRRNPIFAPFEPFMGPKQGIKDETTTIREMLQDADVNNAIEAMAKPEDVAKIIERKFGHKIPRWFREADATPSGTLKNRYEALADWAANMTPEQRKIGFFANHPVRDMESYTIRGVGQAGSLRAIRQMLLSKGTIQLPGQAANQRGWKTIEEAFRGAQGTLQPDTFGAKLLSDMKASMNPQELAQYTQEAAARLKQPVSTIDDTYLLKDLLQHRVSDETATAMSRIANGFSRPEPAGAILKAVDNVTNFWKGWQTGLWPAFHSRNLLSGQVNNWLSGMWSLDSIKDTNALLHGKVVADAMNIPAVQQLAAQKGIQQLTPDVATDLLGEIAFSSGMTSRAAGEAAAVAGIEGLNAPKLLGDLSSEIPRVGFDGFSFKSVLSKLTGRKKGTSLNPLNMRGVGGRTVSEFGPAAAGEELAYAIESFNRIGPFIEQLKRGVDATEAASNVLKAQAVYDTRYFTPFEREAMARVMPFYKFSKAMPMWVFSELKEKPGGKLAQMLRAANRARNPDVMTPDYVSETMSVPLGESPDGSQKYVTGAGLMFEDPLSFLGGGVRGALLEAGSRMNPLLKMPLEWGTGQTFFQKGPMGGRSLEDLDPTIGRTLANLTGKRDPVKFPGSDAVEYLAGNSPLSRALSTGRQMSGLARPFTDPQMKGQALPEIAKTATNLLTGMRVTNVSPAAQESLLRERVQQMMRQAGGKNFIRSYIPAEVEAEMSPQELEDSQKLEALINTLAKRAKARAAARKAADVR